MNILKRRERGFGTVEGILIIVIFALLGVGGWLVYKNHHQTAEPVTTTKPATGPTNNSTEQTAVNVSELGIKLTNVPQSIKDLTYEIVPSGSNQAYTTAAFTTSSLTKLDANCTSIGSLNRYSGTYDASTDQGPFTFVKQFSGFWIAFVHNGVECSQEPTTLNLQTAQMQTFREWVVVPDNVQAAQ
ncbi:MAG TPA: hypothetical protein VLF91_02150 [Candidatus Saccharimonadales bacterium]|nr:hypothetical protein [Candidatus Saccharimonadales bacterium]